MAHTSNQVKLFGTQSKVGAVLVGAVVSSSCILVWMAHTSGEAKPTVLSPRWGLFWLVLCCQAMHKSHPVCIEDCADDIQSPGLCID
jgi:hypothetical protein